MEHDHLPRGRYEVRAATSADGPAILELYRALSPSSLRMRFSSTVSDDVLARAAALSGNGFEALVAVCGDRVVGEARIESSPESHHEFAVTVADDQQRKGVGTALLERLRIEARAHGVVSLRAQIRIDNGPMLTLLRRIGGAIVMVAEGDVVFDIASDGEMPGWPAGTTARKVLIEAPGLGELPVTTALRATGYDVRQCTGPAGGRREPCPLLSGGHCRLVDEADLILCLLPDTEPENREVAAAHVADRPERLGAGLP